MIESASLDQTFKEVACNCCSGDQATTVFEAGVAQVHRIVRCNRCGLLYASPRAVTHEHQEGVEEIHEDSEEYTAQRIEKEELQVKDYARTLRLLRTLYPQRGKLLEVGSGFGYLLAEFRKDGWDVHGIDPYDLACDYTRKTHGIETKQVTVEDADYPEESFDVVIMNHVIEHMTDPIGSLRMVHRLLKRGGHLVIETPRYDTLMFKLLGKRERSVSCDQHIYFFTRESLQKMYEEAGYREVKTWSTGRSLTLERLAWNLGVISKMKGVRKALEVLSRKLKLNNVRIYLNARDIQRVCVQKA